LGHMDDNEQLSKNRGLYIWGDFCLVLCVCVWLETAKEV